MIMIHILAFIAGFLIGEILLIYLERSNKEMAVVYATLIINGKKNFEDVPAKIKEQVKQVLVDLDLEYLTEE